MNKRDFIKDIIVDFHNSTIRGVKSRIVEIPVNSNKIITLVGSRRSGKTYLMLDTILSLYSQINSKENILYFNFEDERLLDFKAEDFNSLYEVLVELFGERKVFFFDEIHA